MAHRRNILQLDDLEFKHTPYNGTASYSQSKLCNLLFTLQLAKGLDGANITANAVHPGWANSSLFKNFENYQAKGDTPEEGARATIYTALRDEVNNFSGKFFFKEHIEEATEMAKDEKLAKALWDKSIEYVSAYL
jgi:NAD(P)-dependent dehydrogenase (short-subunit alcohol dehydrogenase family)